jgi:hypothetical protein
MNMECPPSMENLYVLSGNQEKSENNLDTRVDLGLSILESTITPLDVELNF